MRGRGPGQWYLIVDSVAAGNGCGSPVDAGEAWRIAQAFRLPLRFDQVRTDGFYDDADSARTAPCRTAPDTGTSPRPGTGTVPSATARAWIRTGSQPEGPAAMPVDDDQQQLPSAALAYLE